jgi:putative GTP pyrophosphokinase
VSSQLEKQYRERLDILEALRRNLDDETRRALSDLPHLDRVTFRVKSLESFVEKALDRRNEPPYRKPLVEIEDQVAGRVVVYLLDDLQPVKSRLASTFNTVESVHRRPPRDAEFGYESHHLVCIIPPHLKPATWDSLKDMPTTFELQLRTLFMHAYAEPQHDLAYKVAEELPGHVRRELAWIAASAWGADRAYNRVREWQRREGKE